MSENSDKKKENKEIIEDESSMSSYMKVYEKQSTEKAVRGTQLILHYIAKKGIKINPELINTLTFIKLKVEDGGKLSPEEEAKFWNAYTEVSHIIQPVTVKSLKCIREEFGTYWPWGKKKISYAEKAQSIYRWISIVVLIVALSFQMIWLWQNYMLRDIVENNKKLRANFERVITLTNENPQDINVKEKILNLERLELIEKLNAQKDNFCIFFIGENCKKENNIPATKDTKTNNEDFKPEIKVTDKKENKDQIQDEYKELYNRDFVQNTQALTYSIQILTLYVLPILFGLLGSCTFILRLIAFQIETHIYTRENDIQYALRLILGAFAGLVIGWFISSEAEIQQGFTPSKLSPFAISFLAGYSIDLLFNMMDKIVSLYSGSKASTEDKKEIEVK
ncbi:MAG: hypothetical protein KDK36_07050 [Leptospiraceae bacterium]|nr:hypothetical protein [Leptospiraceae bacterium]